MFIHDDQPQSVYDSFNEWIFSSDRKLFGKLASKLEFTEMTKNVPGDIVELGVFKGSGMLAWLKALSFTNINHKNVIGFDFFDKDSVVESIKTKSDQTLMESLYERRLFEPDDYQFELESIITDAGFDNFDLIKGDAPKTMEEYLEANPGFRASIVNFDLDVEEPTEECLNLIWDRVPPDGVLVFDEYAIGEWTESNAVDRFVKNNYLTLKTTKYFAPSAYVVKY